MRRLATISAALCVATAVMAQSAVFDHVHHDFGTHREDGGAIAHEFVFTNTGKTPLSVLKVQSWCRCTRAEYSTAEVPPGLKGKVKVIYEPWDFPGEADKSVKVTFTDGTSQGLGFHVNIIPRVKPVEEECTVVLTDNVRLSRTDADMRQVRTGESRQETIKWGHTGSRRHSFSLKPSGKVSGLLRISMPSAVNPGERGDMKLVYDLSAYTGAPRFIRDRYDVLIDGRAVSSVSTFVAVTPAASCAEPGRESGAKIRLSTQYHNFGTSARGDAPQKPLTLTLTNAGTAPLDIFDTDVPPGFSLGSALPKVLYPGEKCSVAVNMDSKAFDTGNVFCTLSILTSDPDYPVKEIILSAKIR